MSAILQFKALILTNPLYTSEQRQAAAELFDSMDQDLDNAGPYEPSDITEELIVKFNNALAEIEVNDTDSPVDQDEDDSASITRDGLLEGFDDTGNKE